MAIKLLFIIVFISILAFTLGSCASYQPGFPSGTSISKTFSLNPTVKNIVYSPVGWPEELSADLYQPLRQALKPVVLMVHGGGWSGRSRADMTSTAEKLARQGYAVFNISYRFAPKYIYPAQIHDLQLALQWLVKNGPQYHFDLTRINAWGYSSGAHLVALLSSTMPGDALTLNLHAMPAIRSLVAGGIPANLSKYASSPIVSPFLGGERAEIEERYILASPISHISADDPPVFLYHGKLDTLVESEQSIDYHKALAMAGVETEIYLHRWWGHFAMFLFGWDAENKAIEFLDYHNS